MKDLIQASNLGISLGLYEFEEGEQAVSVDGKFMTENELKEMLIPVTPSETNPVPFVKLSDIAEIELVGKVESLQEQMAKMQLRFKLSRNSKPIPLMLLMM